MRKNILLAFLVFVTLSQDLVMVEQYHTIKKFRALARITELMNTVQKNWTCVPNPDRISDN